MDQIKSFFNSSNYAPNKLKFDKFKEVFKNKMLNCNHPKELLNELINKSNGYLNQISSNSGKISADKCKSIDLNLASSATSTPINCKSMNYTKDVASNLKVD